MTEPVEAVATATSTETVTPAAIAPVVTPAAPVPPVASGEPTWLPERIKRAEESAQKALLKSLGFEKADDAKAAIGDLKKRQDAEKTETERLTAEVTTLKARAAKADEYEAIYAAQVATELAKLTPEQSALVIELAGDDVAKRAKTIERMRASGMLNPPVTVTPVTPVVPVVAPVVAPAAVVAPVPVVAPAPVTPANTAPPAGGPNPATGLQESRVATYERLKGENASLAATYLLSNLAAITAERKARV